MGKNNVTTQGYFIKRLRDNGFLTSRVYDRYSENDRRKWTVVINAETDSVFVTCVNNGDWPHKGMYHVDDGGQKFPANLYINTLSVEVVIKHLLEFKIDQLELNNYSGRSRQETKQEAAEACSEKASV
tara:strand:+ start:675 stop:1058 length:384 start_codon:yes stop_codon:yes gene_type:complete